MYVSIFVNNNDVFDEPLFLRLLEYFEKPYSVFNASARAP
jgi:hypothetical protein